MNSSYDVTNLLLSQMWKDGQSPTLGRLQCLLYIFDGMYSRQLGAAGSLFYDTFHVSDSGPVIPGIQFKYERLEGAPINVRVKDAEGKAYEVDDKDMRSLAQSIATKTAAYSDDELHRIVCSSNSAWFHARQHNARHIDPVDSMLDESYVAYVS